MQMQRLRMLPPGIGAVFFGEVRTCQSPVPMVRLNTSFVLSDTQVSGFHKKTMLMRMQKMIVKGLVQVLVLFRAVVRNRGNL